MDWLQVVLIIIGSSFSSVLLSIGYSLYKTKKEVEREQEYKLYSQLRFYLRLLKITKVIREGLMEDNKQNFKDRTKYIKDNRKKGDLIMENLKNSKEYTTKLIDGGWHYIDLIKKLLEENSKYIRVEDWAIVERFFKEYFVREIVTGKGRYKDTSHLFTTKKIEEAFDGLFKVIDDMYEQMK